MYWNHRVMRRRPDPERYPDLYHLFIVEVYYEDFRDESGGGIIGWTQEESVWGDEEYDGVEGLRQTLHWMLDATEKPVLDEEELLRQAEERGPILEDEEIIGPFDTIEDLLAELDRDDEEGD